MKATLHTCNVLTVATNKQVAGFVICVDSKPVVAINAQGQTILDGGNQIAFYDDQCAIDELACGYTAEELAEEFLEIFKPTPGVQFKTLKNGLATVVAQYHGA